MLKHMVFSQKKAAKKRKCIDTAGKNKGVINSRIGGINNMLTQITSIQIMYAAIEIEIFSIYNVLNGRFAIFDKSCINEHQGNYFKPKKSGAPETS